MDPLTALNVASSVIQIVDFGTKTVRRCFEIYASPKGLPKELVTIDEITRDLKQLNEGLKLSLRSNVGAGPLLQDDQALEDIASKCIKTSVRLIKVLNKTKPQDAKSFLESLHKAFLVPFVKREIDSIAKEMESYKTELQTRVLVMLKSQIDWSTIQQTQSFDKLNTKLQIVLNALANGEEMFARHDLTIEQLHSQIIELDYDQRETTHTLFQKILSELDDIKHGIRFTRIDFNDANVQRRLRETLHFPEINKRQEEVVEAHKHTFEWIFQRQSLEPQLWDSFPHWLENSNGIYWIKGKLGSGKSTLLNFIYENDQTIMSLNLWAAEKSLIKVNFFFWDMGVDLQKSYIGFLRSMIYQILEHQPSLTRICFNDEDEAKRILECRTNAKDSIVWTKKSLMKRFRRLLDHLAVESKLCLFLDGLDEFNEDHGGLTNMIKEITKQQNIKACVSSRELNTFENAFESVPQLKLQDLTRKDIQKMVEDQLGTNEHFRRIQGKKKNRTEYLIKLITDKSSGIFLWTKLVLKSILEGLENFDLLSDLEARVKSLPSEMEALYSCLLQQLEHETPYFQQASKTFQIVLAANEAHQWSSSLYRACFNLDPLHEFLSLLDLSYAVSMDSRAILQTPLKQVSGRDLIEIKETQRARLRSHTAGLVEVSSTKSTSRLSIPMPLPMLSSAESNSEERRDSDRHAEHYSRSGGMVDFVHKSFRDYLLKEETQRKLLRATEKTEFSAEISLSMSLLLQIKTCVLNIVDLEGLCRSALHYASRAKLDHFQIKTGLFEEIDRVATALSSNFLNKMGLGRYHWSVIAKVFQGYEAVQEEAYYEDFTSYAISAELEGYLSHRLGLMEPSHHFTENGRPLLHFCFARPQSYLLLRRLILPRVSIIKLLVNNGSDPNLKFKGKTAWDIALHSMIGSGNWISAALDAKHFWWTAAIQPFLVFGVDLHKVVRTFALDPQHRLRRFFGQTYEGSCLIEWTAYCAFPDAKIFAAHQPAEYHEIHSRFLTAGARREIRFISDPRSGVKTVSNWIPLDREMIELLRNIELAEWSPFKAAVGDDDKLRREQLYHLLKYGETDRDGPHPE